MWAGRGAPAIPFLRVPDATEGDIQKATDLGALGIVVPTVDTVEKAQAAVKWAKYPPLGRRSQATSQCHALWGDDYRQTANDNIMVVILIETPIGVAAVEKIAAVPGVNVLYVASGDLSNFSGKSAGDPVYDAMVARIHDATLAAGLKLGGPPGWKGRPGYSFFLGPEEPALIKMGAKAWLGVAPRRGGRRRLRPRQAASHSGENKTIHEEAGIHHGDTESTEGMNHEGTKTRRRGG